MSISKYFDSVEYLLVLYRARAYHSVPPLPINFNEICIYVDNLITGVRNLQEAKNLYTESKTLFSSASMNLRSRVGFKLTIEEKDRAPTFTGKVLGIIWNHEKDLLVVSGPTQGRDFYKTSNSPSHWIHV